MVYGRFCVPIAHTNLQITVCLLVCSLDLSNNTLPFLQEGLERVRDEAQKQIQDARERAEVSVPM